MAYSLFLRTLIELATLNDLRQFLSRWKRVLLESNTSSSLPRIVCLATRAKQQQQQLSYVTQPVEWFCSLVAHNCHGCVVVCLPSSGNIFYEQDLFIVVLSRDIRAILDLCDRADDSGDHPGPNLRHLFSTQLQTMAAIYRRGCESE